MVDNFQNTINIKLKTKLNSEAKAKDFIRQFLQAFNLMKLFGKVNKDEVQIAAGALMARISNVLTPAINREIEKKIRKELKEKFQEEEKETDGDATFEKTIASAIDTFKLSGKGELFREMKRRSEEY